MTTPITLNIDEDLSQRFKDIDLTPNSGNIRTILERYVYEEIDRQWDIRRECDKMALYVRKCFENTTSSVMKMTKNDILPRDWDAWNHVNNYDSTLNLSDYMNKKHGIGVRPVESDPGENMVWEFSLKKEKTSDSIEI